MRWILPLAVVTNLGGFGCRSNAPSEAPAVVHPRTASYIGPVAPVLAADPVLPSLPTFDDDEPKIGGIAGTVVEPNGEPIVGAVLIATAESVAPFVVISDEDGTYVIDELPPDDYVVTLYYGDLTQEYRTTVGDELVELSLTMDTTPLSFHCGGGNMQNTYIVDEIDTTGLTFD
jgi:Carboxypeptidase regulatory-like domain